MTQWQPMDTAPRDGTLFDVIRNGIRHVDCHIDEHGRLVKRHGHPSMTKVFFTPCDGWMSRPDGLIKPYEANSDGMRYIP